MKKINLIVKRNNEQIIEKELTYNDKKTFVGFLNDQLGFGLKKRFTNLDITKEEILTFLKGVESEDQIEIIQDGNKLASSFPRDVSFVSDNDSSFSLEVISNE